MNGCANETVIAFQPSTLRSLSVSQCLFFPYFHMWVFLSWYGSIFWFFFQRHCSTDFSHPFPSDILGPATIIWMLQRVRQWQLWVMTDSRVGIPGKVTQYSAVWGLMESQQSDLFDASTRPLATDTGRKSTLKMNELENEKVNMIYAET